MRVRVWSLGFGFGSWGLGVGVVVAVGRSQKLRDLWRFNGSLIFFYLFTIMTFAMTTYVFGSVAFQA